MPDAYFIPREDTPPMPPLIDRGDELRFEIMVSEDDDRVPCPILGGTRQAD